MRSTGHPPRLSPLPGPLQGCAVGRFPRWAAATQQLRYGVRQDISCALRPQSGRGRAQPVKWREIPRRIGGINGQLIPYPCSIGCDAFAPQRIWLSGNLPRYGIGSGHRCPTEAARVAQAASVAVSDWEFARWLIPIADGRSLLSPVRLRAVRMDPRARTAGVRA